MRKITVLLFIALFCVTGSGWAGSSAPKAPGQSSGTVPGGSGRYITSSYSTYSNNWDQSITGGVNGDGASWMVPRTLKKVGGKTPVVIFMHGMFAVEWKIYRQYIEHIVKQGIPVIYPQFNKTLLGLLNDTDQVQFLTRAITSTNIAIQDLQRRGIVIGDVVIIGHSVGGMLALCWKAGVDQYFGGNGPYPTALILNNACTDPTSGIPSFISVNLLPWESMAAQNTCPVFDLWGIADTMATRDQQLDVQAVLPATKVYTAYSQDNNGSSLNAKHFAPGCDSGMIPGWALDLMGAGDANLDTLDYRYYWAAVDQVLDNSGSLTSLSMSFAMGTWSNGVAVTPIYNGLGS